MLLKITCPSCNKGKIVLEDYVFICKNLDCDDFNCLFEFNGEFVSSYMDKNITVESGFTGEQTFENESGKYREKYENGKVVECEQLEKYEE